MNKRKFMVLFGLCCGLPLLAAWLVLHFGWFKAGTANKGEWLVQEYYLLPAAEKSEPHWRLVVVAEGGCAQLCQNGLYTIKQLYIGLGRKQDQISAILLASDEFPLTTEYSMFRFYPSATPVTAVVSGYIVLTDDQGLALLRYPLPAEEQMAATAKAIRYDLLKLLNYGRSSV